MYSPELVTAQEELLQAARVREVQPSLYAAAREKLRNWKLTDAQIEAVIAANATHGVVLILADVSGVVVQKRADLGDFETRRGTLRVADLTKLWGLQFDLYERPGRHASAIRCATPCGLFRARSSRGASPSSTGGKIRHPRGTCPRGSGRWQP
ncbi:MAG: efflux RND transporter periplasmic adaptor subunit [Flavobacteriales bacterium]|nr:efflux RND transporter periplasmic adaptor subunit [Flavobacteriales bacterium]